LMAPTATPTPHAIGAASPGWLHRPRPDARTGTRRSRAITATRWCVGSSWFIP
jgi:hypothetical protein